MKNIIKNTNKKGFTIVELVIVIAVIAILAGVLIPTFANVIENANKNAALQEAQSVYKEVLAADLLDGKLDGNIKTSPVMTTSGNTTTVNTTVLESAGIKVSGTINTYLPTAASGEKFIYTTSKGKTVTLSIESGTETWE